MSQEKAKIPYKKPTLTDLGWWPQAEEKIRERAVAQGMSAAEIESLLDEFRQPRKGEGKSIDESEN